MKYKIAVIVALVAASSFADINIAWNSQNNYVGNFDGDGLIADETSAALLWTADTPVLAATLSSSGVGAGEFLLNFTTSTTGGGFAFAGLNYDNDDVGGADINDGYFFTRIFDTEVLSDANYYTQGGVNGKALIDAGSPPDPLKVYGTPVYSSAGGFGQTVNSYVVPEPATFGLMGVAGLGMFLARKKSRR